jgi:hypothetical protein
MKVQTVNATNAIIAGAPVVILMIGRRVKVAVPSIAVAQRIYERMRDESGEGASTFPDGQIKLDTGKILRVSYNGRVWDGGTLIAANGNGY